MGPKLSIYYNFVNITITGINSGSKSRAINVLQGDNPIANIKYNDTTYFMRTIYIYKLTTGSDKWLIIETTSDPHGLSGDILYLVAKINAVEVGGSPIDKILTGTVPTVQFDLKSLLVDGADATYILDDDTKRIYIVLDDTAHSISASSTNLVNSVYTPTAPAPAPFLDRIFNTVQEKNAVIRQSMLDWDTTCVPELEDTEKTIDLPAAIGSPAYSTGLFMGSMALIAVAVYLGTPAIFTNLIVPLAKELPNSAAEIPIYGVSFFWNIVMALIIVQLFVFGMTGLSVNYYYLGFVMLVVWFLANKSIIDKFASSSVANTDAGSFNFASFSSIKTLVVDGQSYKLDTNMMSVLKKIWSENPTRNGIAAFVMAFLYFWMCGYPYSFSNKTRDSQAFKEYLFLMIAFFFGAIAINLNIPGEATTTGQINSQMVQWVSMCVFFAIFLSAIITTGLGADNKL